MEDTRNTKQAGTVKAAETEAETLAQWWRNQWVSIKTENK